MPNLIEYRNLPQKIDIKQNFLSRKSRFFAIFCEESENKMFFSRVRSPLSILPEFLSKFPKTGGTSHIQKKNEEGGGGSALYKSTFLHIELSSFLILIAIAPNGQKALLPDPCEFM